VDVTPDSFFDIVVAAGGSWAGNVYTSEKAGTWLVGGHWGPLGATAELTVIPDEESAPSSVTIAPDDATIGVADTQTYTVTAKDPYGNQYSPSPVAADWTLTDLDGSFDDANTFTPNNPCLGTLHVTVNGVDSNEATLNVRGDDSGAGNVIVWDKDTQKMYLCSDPSDPQTGTELALGTATYSPLGDDITITLTSGASWLQAVVTNDGVTNSLKVQWYMRSGELYQCYQYSTIGGTTLTTTYSRGVSRVDGGAQQAGFYAIGHEPTGYAAGPPATWSGIAKSATLQP
jgi:hypothetical protein